MHKPKHIPNQLITTINNTTHFCDAVYIRIHNLIYSNMTVLFNHDILFIIVINSWCVLYCL